ncbi:MAG: hypothetical protein AB7I41_01105 [Candidatus Sericytochromatia bacterium]
MQENKKISKVFELIGVGYEVKKIQMSYKDGKAFATMSLLKDGKELKVEGDDEFMFFCSRFKKVKDAHNNYQLIYFESDDNLVEDKDMSANINGPVKGNFKLVLSGYEFVSGLTIMELMRKMPQARGYTHCLVHLRVDHQSNSNFNLTDFKDQVKIVNLDNDQLIFKGFIYEFSQSGGLAILALRDEMLKMEIGKVAMEFYQIPPADQFQITVDHANVDYSLNLQFTPVGIAHNTNLREFSVISPIHNLIINEEMKIGTVSFYQKLDSLDDAFIRKSDLVRGHEDWNGNFPRAKVVVKANNYYSAVKIGYKKISTAVDILCLRSDIAFPHLPIGKGQQFTYNHYQHYSRVLLSEWVYCRDLASPQQGHLIIKINSVIDNKLSIKHDPQIYLNRLNKLFEKFISKEILTQEEENQIQALHWLRRAIQTTNKKDKLLDLWTAFEFLISGIPDKLAFSDQEKKKLRRMVKLHKDLSKDQINILTNAINNINFSPLMKKFKFLLEDIGLSFSSWEFELIKSSRDNRNSLIHGRKDVELNDAELDKMATVIEKILIYKLIKEEASETEVVVADRVRTKQGNNKKPKNKRSNSKKRR